MPLYEYKCDECGQVFEVIQRFSDAPLTQHESCGGAVHRLLSAPALQFKGSGWYITDYSKSGSNGKSKETKDGKDTKDSGSSAEKKADTSSSASSSSATPAATSSSSSDKK